MTTTDSSHSLGATPVAPSAFTTVTPGANTPLDQYSFFQALRQIERARRTQPRIGYAQRPVDEPVRIGQPADLAFAPASFVSNASHISSVAATAPSTEQSRGAQPPIQLQQRFLGLLGPAGPMPLHVTEAVRDRARHAGDESLQAFLDIFHHRIATLFYRAWSDAQPIVQHDRPSDALATEDNFARHTSALVGTCAGGDEHQAKVMRDVRRFAAGHFVGAHRHAEGLESILAIALDAPACVRSFALRTLVLATEQRSMLCSHQRGTRSARRTNCLGQSAQLGAAVPDRTSMIDIQVGPVGYAAYQQYLPGGLARKRLANVVRHYAGPAIDARVTIQLQSAEVPKLVLGQSGQLGRTAWMVGSTQTADRDDYRFEVCGAMNESSTVKGVSA